MKFRLIVFSIFLCSFFYAQNTITVNVRNISSAKGSIRVALYKSEDTFLKKPYKSLKGIIIQNKSKIVFQNVPNGIYAISLYHDENNNGKIDLGLFGIPKEPYGCSNGAKGFMGPPKFQDAKFKVQSNVQQEIALN